MAGRLSKRLKYHQLQSYGDYFHLIMGKTPGEEQQIALDLLTTNETYFFREPRHFDFLRSQCSASRSVAGLFACGVPPAQPAKSPIALP